MKPRWIRFWFDEWLAGCVGMPICEIGVYISICCLIYSRGGPIPDDERWLTFACGCGHWRTFRAIRKNLIAHGKIQIEGDKITVKRCIIELEKAVRISSEASQNAIKRWSRSSQNGSTTTVDINKSNGIAHAEALQTRTANQNKNKKEESSLRSLCAKADPPGFADFWKIWPHKVARKEAVEAWPRAIKAAGSLATILDGVERYIASKPADRAFLHPSRFLRHQRWLDQPALNDGKAPTGGNRYDRRTRDAEAHQHALDILGQAARDYDEREGHRGSS